MMSMILGAMLFAYAGMTGLCQGLERHYKQVWGRTCPRVLRLGLRGAVGQGCQPACCCAHRHGDGPWGRWLGSG